MKRLFFLLLATLLVATLYPCTAQTQYSYETVKNDPLNARIYTLSNGLKVYLSVNREQPRIQTYIPVRVGGKNDPDETTGLAHYFEHLMFKGTTHFGTQNYAQEKPMLDRIEQLFEVYRTTRGEAERKALYHQIDSISYEASKLAIPNEYDKLMAAIGSEGSDAYTSYDVTCFTEDIPSNEIENWAKIQSDRFANCVIRGFHTELEAVYEEKNMSLTSDGERAIDSLFHVLFVHHPYGTHTVLGTQEDLKNPSITNIKNYYKKWYVPNNIAICMSGDLDYDKTIAIIDRYFGSLTPNKELQRPIFAPEQEITTPVNKEVTGLEAEQLYMGWRVQGENDVRATDRLNLLSSILSNGTAGLLDLNVNQQQKVLECDAGCYSLADYGMFYMIGRPKEGQSLDEVKNIMLEQMKLLREGKFDESLVSATVANMKLKFQHRLESNDSRASMFVNSFVNGVAWQDYAHEMQRLDSITKEDLVAFAARYLKDNNYVTVYKRQGNPDNIKKMEKPQITPIFTNRDTASNFLKEVQAAEPAPISPVFVDYHKDLTRGTIGSLPLLYKKNDMNDIFTLEYRFEVGSDKDKVLPVAAQYIDYLGTADMSNEQIKKAFYDLACDYRLRLGGDWLYITVSGLAENMAKAASLTEKLMTGAKPDETILTSLKADILKERADSKSNQEANVDCLTNYLMYGAKNPSTDILSADALQKLTGEEVLSHLKGLYGYKHEVLYYGPASQSEVTALVAKIHKTSKNLKAPDTTPTYPIKETKENTVYMAPYDANQVYMRSFTNLEQKYDAKRVPLTTLYNEYFGSGMNGIVFQEMREARGLAYTAYAVMSTPTRLHNPLFFTTFIATQNDKTNDALKEFDEIVNNMPVSQKAFDIAKRSLLTRLRTQRITRRDVIYSYIGARYMGLDYDINKSIYEALGKMTLDDVVKYQQQDVKGRLYNHAILGRESDLDMNTLSKYGRIVHLSTEDIFGY